MYKYLKKPYTLAGFEPGFCCSLSGHFYKALFVQWQRKSNPYSLGVCATIAIFGSFANFCHFISANQFAKFLLSSNVDPWIMCDFKIPTVRVKEHTIP
jgi:hypothetical protein